MQYLGVPLFTGAPKADYFLLKELENILLPGGVPKYQKEDA